MADNLLDAFVDDFNNSDSDEETGRRPSVISRFTDKSAFYKTAVEDQTWLHSDHGDETDTSGNTSPATPIATRANSRRMDSDDFNFAALRDDLNESYKALPATKEITVAVGQDGDRTSVDAVNNELEMLKKRIQQLEEEKARRRQHHSLKGEANAQKYPIDFTVSRNSNGSKDGKPAAPAFNSDVDEEENFKTPAQRLPCKRKFDEAGPSGMQKSTRQSLASPDDPSIIALREKATAIAAKEHSDHRRSSLAGFDPYFGIRIHTPKVSSVTFQGYVGIRQKVRISDLKPDSTVNWSDWVTMGVLVDKTPLRIAANGSQFAIWKLSDLIDCQRVVRLLLFGDTAKSVWKLNKGDVVAILNASKMENKADGVIGEKSTITLSVDSKQKMVELGFCPDYAICKGIRKQDNMPCTNFVNKSKLDYCDFHLLTASKRLASKRGELQLASNVPPKKFNTAAKKVLPGPSLRTSKIPVASGISIGSNLIRRPIGIVATAEGVSTASSADVQAKVAAQLREVLQSNTIGSRQLLSQLSKTNDGQQMIQNKDALLPKPKVTCKQFLATQKRRNSNQILNQSRGEHSKAKAIAILRARGEASKPDPQNADGNNVGAPPAKRPRLLGQISNLSKDQLKRLVEKKSHHEEELKEEDARRQDEYFKVMEAKEKVDQRATEVMSLKRCKVVTCRTCKYTWHQQSAVCKKHKHSVNWHMAEKRFFKCRPCGKRTFAYDKYPNKPCTCGSTTFHRVAMRQASKGPKLVADTLTIRGDEEPFVNA